MRRTICARAGRVGAAVVLASLLAVPPLVARAAGAGAPADGGHAAPSTGTVPSAPSITRDLVGPDQGGVAGTGLGKTPAQGSQAPGTGSSVKGPPGQGIPGAPPP